MFPMMKWWSDLSEWYSGNTGIWSIAIFLIYQNGGLISKNGDLEIISYIIYRMRAIGWFKNPVFFQTEKLMAGTKFSDYLGLNHYKKSKKIKIFHPFRVDPRASKFCHIP